MGTSDVLIIGNDYRGQVERCRRTRRGFFIESFLCVSGNWKLKPGASGIVQNGNREESVTGGFCGSAKKCDIDFAWMWGTLREAAIERWTYAASLCGNRTWTPYKDLWQREVIEKHHSADAASVLQRWKEQPAIISILDRASIVYSVLARESDDREWVGRLFWGDRSPATLDPLQLPMEQYVARFKLGQLVGFSEVIRDGEIIDLVDEKAYFDSLPDTTLLTCGCIHC